MSIANHHLLWVHTLTVALLDFMNVSCHYENVLMHHPNPFMCILSNLTFIHWTFNIVKNHLRELISITTFFVKYVFLKKKIYKYLCDYS